MDKNEITVSICCITYNQRNYIKDAIEGFLKQKTSFKYEVIVHDDASTDGTTEIIREYANKYPDIIKPIFESENQYSKGVKRILNITYKKARGKYIALCEGDDFWTDDEKLQLQVEYMEKNKTCTFCFHNATIFNLFNQEKRPFIPYSITLKKYMKKDGNYNVGELELLEFIPTASFIFRKEYLYKMPDFYNECFVGDWPTKLIMTSFGYAHYIDRDMCTYRMNSIGSITAKNNKDSSENLNNKIKILNEKIKLMKNINEFTQEKYKDVFNMRISQFEIEKLLEQKKNNEIKEKEYLDNIKGTLKFKYILKIYFPKLFNLCKNIVKRGE